MIEELVTRINQRMTCEQGALKDDDPTSTCAAHHRGYLSALGSVLKDIQGLMAKDLSTPKEETAIQELKALMGYINTGKESYWQFSTKRQVLFDLVVHIQDRIAHHEREHAKGKSNGL